MSRGVVIACLLHLCACSRDATQGVGSLDASVTRKALRFEKGDLRVGFGGGVPGQTSSISTVTAADFDGDGKDDLAFGYYQMHGWFRDGGVPDSTVEVASLGRTKSTPLACTNEYPLALVAGRFDRDKPLDFLVYGCQNTPLLAVGIGDGTFRQGPPLDASLQRSAIRGVADFNEDNLDDLFVLAPDPAVLLSDPLFADGTFRAAATTKGIPQSTAYLFLRLDADRHLDVIACDTGEVFFGNGDGTFRAGPRIAGVHFVYQSGDFTGDGVQDLIATDDSGKNVFLAGLGDGRFAAPRPLGPGGSVAADFDLDGVLDLASGGPTRPPRFSVSLGRGDGSFDGALDFETFADVNNPNNRFTPAGTCDLDGDHRPDLFGIQSEFEGAELLTFLNRTE